MVSAFSKSFPKAVRAGLVAFLISSAPAVESDQDLKSMISKNHRAYLPPGPGPNPTVVMFPGCSGIALEQPEAEAAMSQLKNDDRLFRAHYPRVALRFQAQGMAVFLIDILAMEGLVTACANTVPGERIAKYVDEAVNWVRTQNSVDASQIHLIGYSMGGKGVLTWLHGPRSSASVVKSVTAVYPQCRGREPLDISIPVLLLLGDADDIADPYLCDVLVDSSPTRNLIKVHHYPGARHGFDIEDAPDMLDIRNGMSIGYQKAAAEASWNEMMEFIYSK